MGKFLIHILLKIWINIAYYIIPHGLYKLIVNSDDWFNCYYSNTRKHKREVNRIKKNVRDIRDRSMGKKND